MRRAHAALTNMQRGRIGQSARQAYGSPAAHLATPSALETPRTRSRKIARGVQGAVVPGIEAHAVTVAAPPESVYALGIFGRPVLMGAAPKAGLRGKLRWLGELRLPLRRPRVCGEPRLREAPISDAACRAAADL